MDGFLWEQSKMQRRRRGRKTRAKQRTVLPDVFLRGMIMRDAG